MPRHILTCIIVIFILKNVFGQSEDPEYFSSRELSLLMDYQESLCAFSASKEDPKKFDPWFCVRSNLCNEQANQRTYTKPITSCDSYSPVEVSNANTCCYMGNIVLGNNNKMAFTTNKKYWGLRVPYKEAFVDYTNYVYKFLNPEVRQIYEQSRVCGLIPSSKRDAKNDTVFTPYICWYMNCSLAAHESYKSDFDAASSAPEESLHYHDGARFCNTEAAFNKYCCHPSVAVRYDKVGFLRHANWNTKVLLPKQRYAFGFRSSFQCEQYSRWTCDGTRDRCSARVLDHSLAVPGEFPHQAMIGIQAHDLRFFHCAGTLVSKYFILSAEKCIKYDKHPASIALLGDYDMHQYKEFGQWELITFLSEVFVEPYSRATPALVLFRLWRPIKPHFWVRPACIDWKSNWLGYKEKQKHFGFFDEVPKTSTFTGFGTTQTGGRWNATLKRIEISPEDIEVPLDSCNTDEVGGQNNSYVICNGYLPAPCEFDLGGSATTLEPRFAPYCTWRVYAVLAVPFNDCTSEKFLVLRSANSAMPWVEDAIWHFDMHLFQFDVSMPTCYNARENNFKKMIHLFKNIN